MSSLIYFVVGEMKRSIFVVVGEQWCQCVRAVIHHVFLGQTRRMCSHVKHPVQLMMKSWKLELEKVFPLNFVYIVLTFLPRIGKASVMSWRLHYFYLRSGPVLGLRFWCGDKDIGERTDLLERLSPQASVPWTNHLNKMKRESSEYTHTKYTHTLCLSCCLPWFFCLIMGRV